jgi:hypothetical protein
MDRSSGDNTSKFTAFTGDLTPVELPEEEAEVLRKPGKMPSGNDAMPEDLYLPPLQLKSELLKKAVDVENVFSDGTPAVRYDEEYGEDGWHGDDNDHNYIGAPQTAEEVDGQPDPNETTDGSDSERERADESLNRILQLAMVKESGTTWNNPYVVYDTENGAIKKKFKTYKGAKLFVEKMGPGYAMASDEFYHDSVRPKFSNQVKESNYHDSIVEWDDYDTTRTMK